MERTKLVQRLSKPTGNTDVFGDNPFVGASPKPNWGLSRSSMAALRGIVVFDYMGAAEFEWGAIDEGLKKVADHGLNHELIGFVITISLSEVERTYFDETDEPPDGNGTVWVICRADDANEVSRRIRAWAKNNADRYGVQDPDSQWYLCELTQLNAALRPHPIWPSKICGWFELGNGFFFFTDEDMFNKVKELFEVK